MLCRGCFYLDFYGIIKPIMKLPSYVKKYFWEVDADKIDFNKRRVYILKRLLEYGNPKVVGWAWRIFSKKNWLEALRSREISPMTRDFWLSLLSKKKK